MLSVEWFDHRETLRPGGGFEPSVERREDERLGFRQLLCGERGSQLDGVAAAPPTSPGEVGCAVLIEVHREVVGPVPPEVATTSEVSIHEATSSELGSCM